MAFESLTNRLNKAFRDITGKGKLTEKNMNDMLREVRMSLLEADVNYKVVKDFIDHVKEKALGADVMSSLNPSQMVVKIVHDEIVELLGTSEASINFKSSGITTIMMVGLQGTGKTTASAKIANVLKKKKARKPLLVACDIVRPAAIEQLKTLGNSINVEVYSEGADVPALTQAKNAMGYAKANGYDTVLFDTAGRLHIDEELMQELADIKEAVQPDDILLTVDAMTGQDIVTVAQSFNEQLAVTGLVLTKLDGDSRGGGILSVRAITNVPVKFVGQGEKVDDLDIFYPDRMADRILGMGDIVSLVEKAQEQFDAEEAKKLQKKIAKNQFNFNDFLSQIQQIKKMGNIKDLASMIPGVGKALKDVDIDDDAFKGVEAIIYSMTPEERENPELINGSRRKRIASGSGTTIQDVNRLLKQFDESKKMMRMLSKGGKMMGNAPMKRR